MKKPNIVLIVADQLSFRNVGCYGNTQIKTPNIDRLAEKGVLFEHMYAQQPLCMPSRASFNTGMYPHACNVRYNPNILSGETPTLAEILGDSGYATAGFGHIGGDGIERGFQKKVDMVDEPLKSAFMKEQSFTIGQGSQPGHYCATVPYEEEATFDGLTTACAIDYIHQTKGHFYLQLDLYRPHPPFTAPESFVQLYDPASMTLPTSYYQDIHDKPSVLTYTKKATGLEEIGERAFKKVLAHYYASISYVDNLLGQVIDALKEKGIYDNTVIIFTSDHGDYAGEFGLVGKTGNFYDCLTHVPFIIGGQGLGIPEGTKKKSIVELVDLLPTVLDLCGLDIDDKVQGESRMNLLMDDTKEVDHCAFSETSGMGWGFSHKPKDDEVKRTRFDPYSTGPFSHPMDGVMVRKGAYKLSYYSDGSKELFDLEKDPFERNNLANDLNYSSVVTDLLEELLKHQIRSHGPVQPQEPLPYHFKAFDTEALPDAFKQLRYEWDASH